MTIKLKDLENKHPDQIIKYYFSEYSVKTRKGILKSIPAKSLQELNDLAYKVFVNIEKEKADNLPLLMQSIALNSLGFEKNEALKSTCYMDYANKNISKNAKGFIDGQYSIFRNEQEKLINNDPEQINNMISKLEKGIELMIELGVDGVINFVDHLEAIKKDPKSVNGIVKKVLNK